MLTFLVAKFWFPEFVSSYTWHVTDIGGSESGIEIIFAPNEFEILKKFYCLLFFSWSQQKANMSFKLSDFTASPSQELLDLAKKADLLDIADLYGLSNIKKTMLKHEIKNILIQFFVDEEIFDSSTTSRILVTQTDLQLRELEIKRQVEMEKLRLEHEDRIRMETMEREDRLLRQKIEMEEREKVKQREMEREKLEHEKLRLEIEEKERERQERIEIEKEKLQFELKMKELELQGKSKSKPLPLDSGKSFDVTKHIRLVPPFQEKEVDKYFLHFEKVAENLKWPREHWTLLLQSVVIGKA